MNPHLCRVELRARDPLEVFDLTLVFLRERWRPFARLAALVVLPVWLGCSVLAWATGGHWAVLVVPVALGPLLRAPFTRMGGRLLFEDEATVGQVLGDLVSTSPSLVASWLAQGLAATVALLATCGIALPFVDAFLLYLPETAQLERVGPQRGIRRSMRLAGGHLGVALAGAVGKWILVAWFAVLFELTGQQLTDTVLQLGTPFGTAQEGVVTPWALGGVLLAQPLFALYRLMLYVDIRTRLEGWDLQVALRAMGLG